MFSSADVTWTLVGAFLVYFMQAGFALCEAGLTRAKNTGNILMKNLMDFCIGTPVFWIFGFGIMFGGTGAFIGGFDPFIQGSYDFGTLPTWVYALFQTVFCATAATIVSGSMAERTNFKAYVLYSAMISLIVYPVSGHWIWGGGWLSQLGFHDFAGSTAVHFVGGVTACLGAALLGPRIGKYGKDGKPRAILGHSMTAMALGVFILWFCWFGFNGGSTVSMTGDDVMTNAGLICFNTNLAAAVATLTAMIFTWCRYGKPDVSLTFNASLAGLDYAEHGLPTAYAGFAISDPTYANLELVSPNEGCDLGEDDIQKASEAKVNAAVPVVEPFAHSGMHNIVVCCKASKLDELKVALNKAGITGMTVSQVTGYGLQKGAGEMYRGVEVDARLLPKVKVEIVVGNIPYQRIVDVIKQVLYTGHIGDGKIFVNSVEKVVKVRTGEEDLLALTDEAEE